MNPKIEQLWIAMKAGNFPEYKEEEKKWLPTYKLSSKAFNVYVNKKDQS